MEFLNHLEVAASKYTAMYIAAALRVQGTNCLLYKKDQIRTSDNVYGLYSGSELSHQNSVSILDSSLNKPVSKNNYILNLNTDDFYTTNLSSRKTLNEEDENFEIPLIDDDDEEDENISEIKTKTNNGFNIDKSFLPPIKIKVILSNFSWKSYTQFEYGTYEDPAFIFTLPDIDIDSSDILNVELSEAKHLRLKVTFINTIGINENIVNRYQITNIGD